MPKSDYKNMWVSVEHDGTSAAPVGLELCCELRRLCDRTGDRLYAVLIGPLPEAEIQKIADCGVDGILTVRGTGYDFPNIDAWTNAFTVLCRRYRPSAVFVGGTVFGRDFAPRFAIRLNTGCTSDAMQLDWDPETTDIQFIEPAVGGKIMAVITVPELRPQIGTVRPGTFRYAPTGKRPALERIDELIDFDPAAIRVRPLRFAPDENDPEKKVTVSFPKPESIREIVLYDNPDETANVLNAEIRFDDGSCFETGPLEPFGAASRFSVETDAVTSFSVKLTKTEGEHAGLTEVEAFHEARTRCPTFLKLMDLKEDFAYDYIVGVSGKASFLLYSDGEIPELTPENYEVCSEESAGCSAVIRNGILRVFCPRGGSAEISITCRENGLTDRIIVQNPPILKRAAILLSQRMELIELEDHELLHIFRFVGRPAA